MTARRTIKAALAPAWIGFAGAAQVAQPRRTVAANGKKTVEVVYLITSGRDADPATLAARDGVATAVWPSASCAWTAISASPLPTAATPAIRSGR